MATTSYGLVVECAPDDYRIWLLFRGADCYLTSLEAGACREELRLGDLVAARSPEDGCGAARIRRLPAAPDTVWAQDRRLIVRIIVSYDIDLRESLGQLTDSTGKLYIVLASQDLGQIAVPVTWYNKELHGQDTCDVLAFVEYSPMELRSSRTHEIKEYAWRILEGRRPALSVVPPCPIENACFFSSPDVIRRVPAIVVQRSNNNSGGAIVWSPALGTHTAEWPDAAGVQRSSCSSSTGPAHWLLVTLVPLRRHFAARSHCKYTVVEHALQLPPGTPRPPDVSSDEAGVITMTLPICLSFSASPYGRPQLWSADYGLPIAFDRALEAWIGQQRNSTFLGRIQVSLEDADEGGARRVRVCLLGPAAAVRTSPPRPPPPPPPTFENLDDLKAALPTRTHSEGAESPEGAESATTNERRPSGAEDRLQSRTNDTSAANSTQEEDFARRKAAEFAEEERERGGASRSSLRSSEREGESSAWSQEGEEQREDAARWNTIPKIQSQEKKVPAWSFSSGRGRGGGAWAGRGSSQQQTRGGGRGGGAAVGRGGLVHPIQEPRGGAWTQVGRGGHQNPIQEPRRGAWTQAGRGGQQPVQKPSSEEEERPAFGCWAGRGRGAPPPGRGRGGHQRPPSSRSESTFSSETGYNIGFSNCEVTSEKPAEPVEQVRVRVADDASTEAIWRAEMEAAGWAWPATKPPPDVSIEDWDPDFGPPNLNFAKCPLPQQQEVNLLQRRVIMRDLLMAKSVQCLITGVTYRDDAWTDAERIELFVLSGTPAIIVHNVGPYSALAHDADLHTPGNVVDVNIIKRFSKYEVYDEGWHLVEKIKVPIREKRHELYQRKTIELIVTARCLSQETQDRHNDRHRYNKKGFTMLSDTLLHNICYYGKAINARECDEFTYQVAVECDECLENHAFWRVTELLWKVQFGASAYLADEAEAAAACPRLDERQHWPKPRTKIRPYEPKEPKTTRDDSEAYGIGGNVTVPRETRMEELMMMYERLLENESLMFAIRERTGTDYAIKFRKAQEVARSSMPHQKSMKRELQVNADFLITIVENLYAETVFTEHGERKLWKMLVKTSENIKAFRSTVNNR